jgi:DNA-binding HxlR family transcriptional regulator
MTGARTYNDSCAIARALDAVGERWALLVVRELLLGPKRFKDLRTGLPHIGPDILAQRLRELEREGILRKTALAPPASTQVYELTERGFELRPIVFALARWGSTAPMPPKASQLGIDSLALALQMTFQPGVEDLTCQLNLTPESFACEVTGGAFTLERGVLDDPDLVLETDVATFTQVIWQSLKLEEVQGLAVTGNKRLAKRFLKSFAA